MEPHKTALERAFELAGSGQCLNINDIVLHLHSEGYSVPQLEIPILREQLMDLIDGAIKSDC